MAAAGSSSSDKASLGSAMDSVLSQFDSRVSMLKSLLSLRDLTASPACALSSLEALDMEISALEVEVTSVRSAILSESQVLRKAEGLRKRAERTAAELHDMSSNLPALLPGDACDAASGSTRMPLSELGAETAAANHPMAEVPPPPPPPPRSGSSAQPTPRGGRPPPPPLSLVTEAEFGSAPQYMRSRLDVPKVNAALAEVQKVLQSKYALLCLPPSGVRQLPDAERKRHAALKAAEGGDATKGLYFFSEEDLKGMQTIRAGADGKNLLAILRHVGRLKEFKLDARRCWQIR